MKAKIQKGKKKEGLKAFFDLDGEGGIRTHVSRKRQTDFESAPL